MSAPESPAAPASPEPPAENATGAGGFWLIALVLLLAYGLRMVAVFQYEAAHPLAESPVIDERSYDTWAREIAAGDWVGEGVFFQEPLYPYWMGTFYAAYSTDRTGVRHAQAFLGALTVGLVFLVTRRLFGSGAALAAALLVALHRPLLLFPALLLKPNLFLPVLAGLLLLLVASRERDSIPQWAGVGLLAGLGALLRGNLLLLLPALVSWPVLRALLPALGDTRGEGRPPRRERLRAALPRSGAVLLGVAAVLAPVIVRNAVVGGVPALTTSGAGTNVYGGNNADNPYGIATEFDWVRGIPEHEADDWRHEAQRRLGRELDAGEVSRYWLDQVGDSIRREPGLHARILWNKLRLTLGAYEVPDNHHLDWDARYVPLVAAPFPGWGVLGTLGLAGLLLVLFRRPPPAPSPPAHSPRAPSPGAALEVALLFALYLGTIVATVTSMRIRLALVPLLAPFAGLYVAELVRLVREARGQGRRDWRTALSLLLPLVLALPVVLLPVFGPEEVAEELLERDYNHAVHLLWSGTPSDLERAHDLARELDRARPGSPSVANLLAEIEIEQAAAILAEGDPEATRPRATPLLRAALARLRTVVLDPATNDRDRFRANAIAAHADVLLGQWERAERRLREALVFDPEDPALREQLARALVGSALGLETAAAREPLLREAEALLAELAAESDDPVVRELLGEVRALLALK